MKRSECVYNLVWFAILTCVSFQNPILGAFTCTGLICFFVRIKNSYHVRSRTTMNVKFLKSPYITYFQEEEELKKNKAETIIIVASYTFRDENILNLNEFGRNGCQISIYETI